MSDADCIPGREPRSVAASELYRYTNQMNLFLEIVLCAIVDTFTLLLITVVCR